MKSLEDGYRLPPPVDCPSILYELMKNCWSHDRMRRPHFQEIRAQLQHFSSSPHLLRCVADFDPRVTLRLPSCSGSDGIPYRSIPEWLESIRMKRYISNFRTAGLDTMESILDLTAEDLKQMGVSLPGHQKRILCSIQGFKEWPVVALSSLPNAVLPDITWNHSYGNCFQMSDWDKQSKTTRTEKTLWGNTTCSHFCFPLLEPAVLFRTLVLESVLNPVFYC